MTSEGSITGWLRDLKKGDADASRKLWERYCTRLVMLARKHLQDLPQRAFEEEDVALSAFDSFCRGVEKGQFSRLDNRRDLWSLLLAITLRKAIDQIQHERR